MNSSIPGSSFAGVRDPRGPRGFVAVLMMLTLCWIAAIAGLRALIVANSAIVSRAYDSARQDEVLAHRLERVVAETVLGRVESERVPPEGAPMDGARAELAKLDSGGVTIEPVEAPVSLPSFSSYPGVTARTHPLGSPGPSLLAVAGPQLRAMMGGRVAEYPPDIWVFSASRKVLGVARRATVRVESRILEVPLSRYPILAYELPSETGVPASQLSSKPLLSALPPGLAAGRDVFQVTSLFSAGTRPYHYRRRASVAVLCQYLCSQAFVNRVALVAGPSLRHDLGVSEAETARLAGLVRTGDGATMDLGLAGQGSWNGRQAQGSWVVISSSEPNRALTLSDSLGDATATPLHLVIIGEPGAGLSIVLGSVQRPTLLFAFNATLRPENGAVWNGALFLDPGCRIAAEGAVPLHLAHLAYAASGEALAAGTVLADLPMPQALEETMPAVRYVCTNTPEP